MIASLLAVTNPGDEVIVFEPFYENYRPGYACCAERSRKFVRCVLPTGRFDPDELRRALSTRAPKPSF